MLFLEFMTRRRRTIFDPEVDVYLMEHIAHAQGGRVGQHDEPQVACCLVKVQLVLSRAVADECVVFTAELAHHVAEREDGAEDQLGIVAGLVARAGAGCRRGSRRGDCTIG